MVLGIALPLLCLQAIENIPKNVIAKVPRHSCPVGITDCGIVDDHNRHQHAFDYELESIDSIQYLKLSVVQPLKSAFTLVYQGNSEEIENAQLIGQVNQMGDYQFKLQQTIQNQVFSIFLYDKLNQKVLFTTMPSTKRSSF